MIVDPGTWNIVFKLLLPNWQYYWVADRVGEGHSVPIAYFISCAIQAIGLSIVWMIIAVMVYENKEVDSNA